MKTRRKYKAEKTLMQTHKPISLTTVIANVLFPLTHSERIYILQPEVVAECLRSIFSTKQSGFLSTILIILIAQLQSWAKI